MIYYGTKKVEHIYFHLEDDVDDLHYIEMERDADENVFYVRACCDHEWEWKFHDCVSNYEIVKHAIFDAGFDAEDIGDMLYALDSIFEDIFDGIIIWDCECNCNNCNCK